MCNKCRICGNEIGNEKIVLKNIRKDLNEKFDYYKCGSCGCIQIMHIPNNLDDYYDNTEYYSFQNKGKRSVKSIAKYLIKKKFLLGRKSYIDRNYEWLGENYERMVRIFGKNFDFDWKILDVGCGGGSF